MKCLEEWYNKMHIKHTIKQKSIRRVSLTIEETIKAFKYAIRLRINKVPHVY